jgi:hypothetical protein
MDPGHQKRRCFVISPIGEDDSEIREHADNVYDYIIEPAMKECEIDAIRSDRIREPGRISDLMFRELLNDDFCVAVLTGHNPNVYYELAIAQAALRPVIILLLKGQNLPFDVKDLRCVYYDLKPRPLMEKAYQRELIEHIKGVEKCGWKAEPPWGVEKGGTVSKNPDFNFFDRASEFGAHDRWLKLLRNTENIFEIMGITLGSWKRTRNFVKILKERAEKGCQTRIMVMHRDNPALPQMINDEDNIRGQSFGQILEELDEMTEYFATLANDVPGVKFRQMFQGYPHLQVTLVDDSVVVIPYFFSQKPHEAPLYDCSQNSTLYALAKQEFESLWNANEPAKIVYKSLMTDSRGPGSG